MMGKRRDMEEDIGEPIEQAKRMKQEGIAASNIELQNGKTAEKFRDQSEEESTSIIREGKTALNLSDKLVPMPTHFLGLDSPAEISCNDALKNCKGFQKSDSEAFGFDLNDPFYPYKKLGQIRPTTAASECGSTTGQVEISESMRKWNEMKQNGFLSSLQVKTRIPMPKRRNSSTKNDKEVDKMMDTAKRELTERSSVATANPSQLLSGLNPGIIKHVRNSKQVNSIIKAMLRNELIEKNAPGSSTKGGKDAISKPLIPCCRNKKQYSDSDMSKNTSEFNSEVNNDDALRLKLSNSVTISSEKGCKTKQEDITSLSVKAANVALQWLKLIQHDIIARQAAIQRSKKRVKNAIEELPYLFSRDLHTKPEKEPSLFGHSFLTKCSQKENFNVHLARWKAVFSQMEVSLTDEEDQLKKWLRQVEELKLQCEEGLRYVNNNGFLHLDAAKESRILKSQETYEREFAVRAAAASIYSTCNMIMMAENGPCI